MEHQKETGTKETRCRSNKANTLEWFLSVSSSQVFVLYSTKFKNIRIVDTQRNLNSLNEKG